jgi:hypothetical protein
MQVGVMANDHSLDEMIIKDEFDEFAAIHFKEFSKVSDIDCPYIKIIIHDLEGNILRQLEVSKGYLNDSRSILWPLLNRSQFLTEVNGVMLYLFDDTDRYKAIFNDY